MSIKSFRDLEVHQIAEEISDIIWNAVLKWDSFSRYGLGSQLTEAADSISFNIAEGYGRYHFKENRNFCFYARGSLSETQTGIMKAKRRNLIDKKQFDQLDALLSKLLGKLNRYIDSIGRSNSH
jgi:four helix bundle protein